MNQELEQYTVLVQNHLRNRFPTHEGWTLKANVQCGGAVTDFALTRNQGDVKEAIPVLIVAGNWITPIYSRILFKWKSCANAKGILVPELLLFGRPGTIKDKISATISYQELEPIALGKVG